jgi:hypothetical protein
MAKNPIALLFAPVLLCLALGACSQQPTPERNPSSVQAQPNTHHWASEPGSNYQTWKPHNKAAD